MTLSSASGVLGPYTYTAIRVYVREMRNRVSHVYVRIRANPCHGGECRFLLRSSVASSHEQVMSCLHMCDLARILALKGSLSVCDDEGGIKNQDHIFNYSNLSGETS